MASEGGQKPEGGRSNQMPAAKPRDWVIPLLRLVAFLATGSATIVMALNKQTNTLVVATVGSTPMKLTLTAKFQHNPAFVFFVVANGIASLHNLLMLAVEFNGHSFDLKFTGLRFVMLNILDMMMVGIVSGGASAAAFMGELGKNGNSHARWNKICDKFDTFCDHASGAFIASFIGLLLLITINVMSIIKLYKRESINCSVAP